MTTLGTLAALVLSAVAFLGLAASARADLYWVSSGGTTISRSTLDGDGQNASFVPTSSVVGDGLAVDLDLHQKLQLTPVDVVRGPVDAGAHGS